MNKVYVIIGGVGGILTSFFLYYYLNNELYTSREHNLLYRLSSVSVLFVCVLFAIIAIKKMNGNMISFMRCMFSGFIIAIICGLVNFAFFTTWYLTNPKALEKAETVSIAKYLEMEETKKEKPEIIQKVKQEIHSQFTPGGSLLPNLMSSFVTCMISAIFISAFVYTRSERQP